MPVIAIHRKKRQEPAWTTLQDFNTETVPYFEIGLGKDVTKNKTLASILLHLLYTWWVIHTNKNQTERLEKHK